MVLEAVHGLPVASPQFVTVSDQVFPETLEMLARNCLTAAFALLACGGPARGLPLLASGCTS